MKTSDFFNVITVMWTC